MPDGMASIAIGQVCAIPPGREHRGVSDSAPPSCC